MTASPDILTVAAPVLRAMDALVEELRGARADYRAGAKLRASERSLLAVMEFPEPTPSFKTKVYWFR